LVLEFLISLEMQKWAPQDLCSVPPEKTKQKVPKPSLFSERLFGASHGTTPPASHPSWASTAVVKLCWKNMKEVLESNASSPRKTKAHNQSCQLVPEWRLELSTSWFLSPCSGHPTTMPSHQQNQQSKRCTPRSQLQPPGLKLECTACTLYCLVNRIEIGMVPAWELSKINMHTMHLHFHNKEKQ
jgi:hypothetical protein